MKHGDIGHVEATFLHWMFIFKSGRKHKYSAYLMKVIHDMKYLYDKKLQHIIWMNWLINPTEKPDGYHTVDWVVELINLYKKVSKSAMDPTRWFSRTIGFTDHLWKYWNNMDI